MPGICRFTYGPVIGINHSRNAQIAHGVQAIGPYISGMRIRHRGSAVVQIERRIRRFVVAGLVAGPHYDETIKQGVLTMPELELNRDTIRFVIDTAREFHAREEIIFPEEPENANEDLALQVSTDFGDDPYYQEMKSTINDLEPDQQVSLVALMWVGRGDYSLKEWGDALRHAEDSANDHTADYLIGTPLLSDYLEEGIEIFELGESSAIDA